jgi:multisubunit Na+/H+ antiporter MnhF subunit
MSSANVRLVLWVAAAVLVGLAVLAIAVPVYRFATGRTVQATVISNIDDVCTVEWTQDLVPYSDSYQPCFEVVGNIIPVRVRDGHLADLTFQPIGLAIVLLVPVLIGRTVTRRVRRRREREGPDVPVSALIPEGSGMSVYPPGGGREIKLSTAGTRRVLVGAAAVLIVLAALQFTIPIYRYATSTEVTAKVVGLSSSGNRSTCTLAWTVDGVQYADTQSRCSYALFETVRVRARGNDIVGLPVHAAWGALILLAPIYIVYNFFRWAARLRAKYGTLPPHPTPRPHVIHSDQPPHSGGRPPTITTMSQNPPVAPVPPAPPPTAPAPRPAPPPTATAPRPAPPPTATAPRPAPPPTATAPPPAAAPGVTRPPTASRPTTAARPTTAPDPTAPLPPPSPPPPA